MTSSHATSEGALVKRGFANASPAAIDGACVWIDTIRKWNARIDITAARDAHELMDLMLADAAQLASHIEVGCRVVDVGSGGGAPGLPLALLREDLELTLVEPMQKRTALLRMTIGKLGLTDRVKVAQMRGEELSQRFDVAISRATLPPEMWLRLGAELAPEVWVLLAQGALPAMPHWEVMDVHSYRWPLTDAQRRLVRYCRADKLATD